MNKVHNKKSIVLVAGTFDRFHKGHESFLSQAKKHGKTLHVIIAREKNVEQIKGKKPRDSEEKRKKNVEHNINVSHVILGDSNDFLRIPKEINPDIICIGYDQNIPKKLKEEFPHCRIITMESFFPEKYKSSLMK